MAVRQQDACTNIILVSQPFPSPNNRCPRMADHPFKWVWILEDWSENGCGKLYFLVWNRVRVWRTGWHTPHQKFPGVSGADLGGGCRGCTPPPPWDDLRFSNTTGILQKKIEVIVVEVEQEMSAPPPKKNPGSAPESAGSPRPSHLSLLHPNRASLCWLNWNQTYFSLTPSFFRSLRQILKAWSWTKQELSKKRKEKLLLQRLNSTNR